MGECLSFAQIEKYAARLMGQRLLPVLKKWQLKRAIKRLAIDGRKPSLDALKDGATKGVLSRAPYQRLLDSVLDQAVEGPAASRVRAYIKTPEPVSPQPAVTPPKPVSAARIAKSIPSTPQAKTQVKPESELKEDPKQETFSSSINPLALLKQHLNNSTPVSTYRAELRERVHKDTSKSLLDGICGLWDKSSGTDRDALRDLIRFIELAPDRPLWLRRNVALDCGMPWQLADDSPAIAQHLVATTQLRTRKLAVIGATQLLRRDDTKAEICRLWYEQYKKGVHDSDFDDVLTQMGFLPRSPIEERVAIALTCGWGERLAFDEREVLDYLLPLLDDSRLGNEARRAIENIKNPSTLKALKNKADTVDSEQYVIIDNNQQTNYSSIISEVSAANPSSQAQLADDDDAHPSESDLEIFPQTVHGLAASSQETIASKPQELGSSSIKESQLIDQVIKEVTPCETQESVSSVDKEATGHESSSASVGSPPPIQSSQAYSPKPKPYYLDFRQAYQEDDDWEEISLAAVGWNDEDNFDTQWISRLDRLAGLDPDERRRIISEIANGHYADDDWITELLSEDFGQYAQLSVMAQSSLRSLRSEEVTDKTSEDNKWVKLEEALISKGAIISYEGDNLIVSARHSGNIVETNRISSEELRGLSNWELEDLIDGWPLLDQQQLVAENDIQHNLSSEDQDGIIEDNKDPYLEKLFLDDLSHAKLDSASVFLVECASDLLGSGDSHHLSKHRELIAGLLTFHARERSAEIKAYEEHMEMSIDALRRDSDCIAEAVLEEIVPYKIDVFAARYRFDPQQPFRFITPKGKKREKLICQSSRTLLELESIEEMQGVATVLIKSGSKNKLESRANFIHVPQDFSQLLRQNLAQQASRWIKAHKSISNAFLYLLNRQGHEGIAILNRVIDNNSSRRSDAISEFLRSSDGISLVIQGPPGSGKTTCAAEIICQLSQAGLKIGVSANSHLAIDTLLEKTSQVSQRENVNVRVVKYRNGTTAQERKELKEKGVCVVDSRSFNMLFDVCGGTAHAFSKSDFEDLFDLLVVDEASQVSLASLMAMARCTKNILLVGDQQQLRQPTIANHPGESGMSCLGYASSDQQTVSRDIGIFLSRSWRMHPNVCNYISTTFYESKLESHAPNAKNSILSSTPPNGILYLPIEHDNNYVFSLEEAEYIRDFASSLIGEECCINKNGEQRIRPIKWEDIAIMAPYNAQASLIKRVIGPSARVGTVDKFQGQEALISIYSVTTSYADNPSAFEFVLNKNRVNVALSRSQCMSVVVGSPSLVGILNSTPELEEQRKVFFALANYISYAVSSDLECRSISPSLTYSPRSTSGIIRLSELFDTSSEIVPISDELHDIASIQIAKKLFHFDLSSQHILDLYRHRLYNELSLSLVFCGWDKSEKEWNRTKLFLRLASSPTTPPLLLERLAQRGGGEIRQALAANPKTPLHVIKDIITRESLLGMRGAAENPDLPEEFYIELFFEDDELISRALAGNPTTPLDILRLLVDSQCELTKSRAEANLLARSGIEDRVNRAAAAPGDMRSTYSLESDSPQSIASNPCVPPSHLASFVSSKDQKVRLALAANPSLANEDIRRLAFDSDDSVRCALANRRDLPADVVRSLACDQSRFVRRILTENPTCTEEALKRLVSDSDVYVRERVAQRASLPARICSWILSDTDERVFLAFADNEGVPASIFAEAQRKFYIECLQGPASSSLKALLLLSQGCPAEVLSDICIPSSPEIQLALVLSPSCPSKLLSKLARDADPAVADIAAKRLSQAA